MSIIEHVYFCGEEGNLKALVEEYTSSGNLNSVREETGCVRFEFCYMTEESGKVLLLERWRDNTCLEAHHETQMMKKLLELVDKYGITLEAEKFEVL